MSVPTPARGICSVSDIERLLKPKNKAQDFKYSSISQPTIREVCNEIDLAWDELQIMLDFYGILTPVVENKTKRYIILLNSILASANIENGTHNNEGPKESAKGNALITLYDKKSKWFFENANLEPEATNDNRPTSYIGDMMFSNMADLYDNSKYDTKKRQAAFRIDKEF